MVAKALAGVPEGDMREKFLFEFGALVAAEAVGSDPRWRDLYLRACAVKRVSRSYARSPRNSSTRRTTCSAASRGS